ncbi:MAG: tetratricopeptide repeat protein [Deltaproteobacteria bacterium]|nr:tetratricopeptide repeat protein [Deltaproteobacteria bacterium]
MKVKTVQILRVSAMVFLACLAFLAFAFPLRAAGTLDKAPDVTVKIGRLEKSLEVIDALAAAAGTESGMPPSAILKGMIQGTDWIDASRSIVIGIEIKDPKPDMALLIPFKRPNPNFEAGFQALLRSDYYYLAFPPGAGIPSKTLEPALASAARSRPDASVSAVIRIDTLLKKADPKIQQALSALKNLPPDQSSKEMPFSPDQLKTMAENFLHTANQLKTLEIRVDFSLDAITSEMALAAHEGTEMADLFTKKAKTSRVEGYRPQLQMTFSSRAFNAEKALSVIGDTFGAVYQKMGIDFSKLIEISSFFTGEMTGGMSVTQEGVILEMIHVLEKENGTENFIETIYLPWLTDFGRNMQQAMEKQLHTSMEPVFVRTPDSTVAGRRVYGVQFRMPMPPVGQPAPDPLLFKVLGNYTFRMTVMDDLLLSASTDQRLARLIENAKRLKPAPATGPLMAMEYDLTAYMESLKMMLPGISAAGAPLPPLGKVTMMLDAEKGRVFLKSRMKTRDLQNLIAYVRGRAPDELSAADIPEPEATPKKATEPVPVEAPADAQKPHVVPWLKKGALAMLNGDNASAVTYFTKAVNMDPENAEAHFHLGVALGEMGDYPKAVDALTRAVSLNPEKGRYRYARGRVHLLSGKKERAMIDFKAAAELGDRDARAYLDRTTATLQD